MGIPVVVTLMAAALLPALVSCDDNPLPAKSGEAEPSADVRVLAERYAPVVWLAKGDEYGPGDASHAAERAPLWLHDLCDGVPSRSRVADRVELRRLGGRDEAYSASSCADVVGGVRSDEDTAAGDGRGFFLDLDDSSRAGDPKTAPLYWQSVVDGDRTAIVYWLFYPYNDFINDDPDVTINTHEGDWERVAVQFRDGQPEPIGMTFWKHNEPECFVWWRELDVDGDRPVVYSASGSHGSYPWPGTYDTAVADKINDVATKGTRWAGRPRSVVEEPWWGYRGRWGYQVGAPGADGPHGPYPGRPASSLGGEGCARPDTPAPEVPEVFRGAWYSPAPVVQPTSDKTYHVEITITEPDGDIVGETHYPGLGCRGVLRFSRSDPSTLVVTGHIEEHGTSRCAVDGSITLRPDGDGLRWEYTEAGASQVTATADLVRKRPSVPQDEPTESTIPDAFLDQWQAPEPMSRPGLPRPYYVRLQLWGEDAPLADGVEGLSEYSEDFSATPGIGELACSNDLALVEVSADKVVFAETERFDTYENCPDKGTVTLTLSGDQLVYDYVGDAGSAHTTLVRR